MTEHLRRESEMAVQVVMADGRCLSAGRAMLFVLEMIGWHPRLVRWLARPPMIWAVELGYRIVARHRSFFGRFLFRSF